MDAKRLYLVILVLIIGCWQACIAAEGPTVLANANGARAGLQLDEQLEINRNALLNGPSEQIRIKAATVMLVNENPLARKILCDALKQSENAPARIAVCRALSQTRGTRKHVKNKLDFMPLLLEILTMDTITTARLAAEATLIFEYTQIAKQLGKLIKDPSLQPKTRLNVVYALKLRPDKDAIFMLIDLLDDSDKEIASAAEKALTSLGIPVAGKDAETRRQIRNELERKSKDEFLRDWLIRQDDQMRELKTQRDQWRELYLAALDKIYDTVSGDEAKGKFLAERLGSTKDVVKLWALEKVYQGRVATKSKLPAELGPILVNLISDQNRDVRLKAAELIPLMGQLNSAEKLLEQHKVEQDDEVRTKLFGALGWACYYASLPDSTVKVSPEVRRHTLELAEKCLFQQNPKKAQKGAEVIKKLLEQDGLKSAEVDKYLNLLLEKYKQQRNNADGSLRGELLSAMAELCAQSVYKSRAAKLFRPLFEQSLGDQNDLVREAAVDGLIYIDNTRAMKILRKDSVNDKSAIIRKRLIDLASRVGSKEDLPWLVEKTVTPTESEPAWQAMLKIFERSKASLLNDWLRKFDSKNHKTELSDGRWISFLEIAERKAAGEKKVEMLDDVRGKLARLYTRNGKFEQAAKYFGALRETARTAEDKEIILGELMDVYLRWPNVERAAKLVDNYLLEKDLEPNSTIVLSIDKYLSNPPAGTDPNAVVETLIARIKTANNRAKWAEQKKRWTDYFSQAKKLTKSKESGNQP